MASVGNMFPRSGSVINKHNFLFFIYILIIFLGSYKYMTALTHRWGHLKRGYTVRDDTQDQVPYC